MTSRSVNAFCMIWWNYLTNLADCIWLESRTQRRLRYRFGLPFCGRAEGCTWSGLDTRVRRKRIHNFSLRSCSSTLPHSYKRVRCASPWCVCLKLRAFWRIRVEKWPDMLLCYLWVVDNFSRVITDFDNCFRVGKALARIEWKRQYCFLHKTNNTYKIFRL